MNLIQPLARVAISLIERGLVPEPIMRMLIRQLIGARYRDLHRGNRDQALKRSDDFLERAARENRLALETEKANEQHYEVPAEFFELVLGARKKYSSCYFTEGCSDLNQAEEQALAITCQHAGINNGMSILELGCGWGSLTLWMAEKYPDSPLVAVSNSASQRDYILEQAKRQKLDRNLQVLTCDINDLQLNQSFDRIVSVEMFEHVRNHRRLLERISQWLAADGQLFVHIFCHQSFAYPFETEGATNWMGRYFFSGGMMPNRDLFDRYRQHLQVCQQWSWNGCHYQQTANGWAANLDRNRSAVLELFRQTYGAGQERKWFLRWKVFFLACAELFGYQNGNEWFVQHYLLKHAGVPQPTQPTHQAHQVGNR